MKIFHIEKVCIALMLLCNGCAPLETSGRAVVWLDPAKYDIIDPITDKSVVLVSRQTLSGEWKFYLLCQPGYSASTYAVVGNPMTINQLYLAFREMPPRKT